MISFKKYSDLHSIHTATLYRWIESGEVLAVKDNGETFIIDNNELSIKNPKAIEAIKAAKREDWNRLILQVHQKINNPNQDAAEVKRFKIETIAGINRELKHWELKGVQIPGYNDKSIYRKLKKGNVKRAQRCDKYSYKKLLSSSTVQQKLLAVAWHLFGAPSAKLNYSLMADKVFEYGSQHEEFFELAAISRISIYRFLSQEFKSMALDTAHKFLNHYNLYKDTRARNKGAFTNDIKFMDYIIGDDHKMDIDKVLVWNDLKKCFTKETVRGWFWIEGKTQKILSYVLSYKDLTAEDLKLSFLEALQNYGAPNKAVMIDNGIGRSAAFQDFCLKCKINMHFSAPYEPTQKATVERCFQYMKEEFDVYEENFVGANHPKEGRHRSSVLSPEECKITFEEYSRKLHAYLNGGFYETRERNRVLDNKKIRISIKEFFESFWRNHEKKEVGASLLRYAYQSERLATYRNGLSFTINKRIYNYMPSPDLSPVFNNKVYQIGYNPNDMNKVDLRATVPILDKSTGWNVEKGDLVATLESFELFTTSQRKARIYETNKKIGKHLKQIGDLLIDKNIPAAVSEEGSFVDNRKALKKEVLNTIKNAMPLKHVETIVVKASQVKKGKIVKRQDETSRNGDRLNGDKIEVNAEDWAALEK